MPIEFDYTIKRYEGTSIREFKPEAIKSPLSNISIISAPNSSGKSTLMNLIALSLFGTDNKAVAVNESLKKQLSFVTDESIQHIIFWLKITDLSGKNGLFISKGKYESMDIVRKEIIDGLEKNIDSDRFHEKYKLIYDIPDNPLERLKELTYSVRDQQRRWQSRLIPLRSYLSENIKDLIKRKQEYDVISLEHNITTENENLDSSRKNESAFAAKLSSLEKYYYLKKYLHLKEEYDSIKDESKEVNKVKREHDEEKYRKIDDFNKTARERGKIQEEIKRQEEMIAGNIIEAGIIDLPGLQKWRAGTKQAPTSQSLEDDLSFAKRMEERCNSELNKDESKSSVGEVEFYDKLLSWLRFNMTSNYKIPSTEMTFSSLISILDEIVTKSRKLLDNRRRFMNTIELIDTLRKSINHYRELGNTISKKYSDMSDAQKESKIKEILDEKRDYDETKKELKKDMQSMVFELSKLGFKDEKEFQKMLNTLIIRFPELESYESFPLDKIEKEISGTKSKIDQLRGDQQREDLKVKSLEKQLAAAINAEPHRFEGSEDRLRELLESIDSLTKIITSWEGYIGKYESKSGSFNVNMKADTESADYFSRVSKYMADRMKTVDHIDKKYELKEVDLINSKFVAKDGTVIQFQVMGTGQKQLTHILNKLSYDGRVIIAMFDEVAMMSPSTMRDIVNKMRALMDDGGKLLAGLLVSPSDKVNITDG